MRRFLVIALVLTVATSCSGGFSDSTSTSTAESTTSIALAPTVPFTPGAPGIGDDYYPGLGNGGYDVEHYRIDLRYEENGTLDGGVVIDAVATQNLSGFNLDFAGWDITGIVVDGTDGTYSREGEELIVTGVEIPEGDTFRVRVNYSGTPIPYESDALPFPIGWLVGPEGEHFVVTEPDAAHSWFPSNDHPLDKATFTIVIAAPGGYGTAANGERVVHDENDVGVSSQWEMRSPMAPYLATIVLGDGWQIVPDSVSTEVSGVVIRNLLPADLAENVPPVLERTGEMINVLEEAFGPYPFDRYGIAVVGGFQHALENQTLSVFGRAMLEAPFFEYVHVHELAHQWFGNSVSVAQWSDIWLNEGFATFAELLWVEHLHGSGAYREEVANRLEASRVAGYGPPATPPPNDLFNGSVYLRGALVLVALRDEIGDEAFFQTLRTYANRYADGNATTEQFIAIAEEVSNQDLDSLFSTWLYGQELPD